MKQMSFFEEPAVVLEEPRLEIREVLHIYAEEENILAKFFGQNGETIARKLFAAFPGMQLVINAEPAALARTIGAEPADKLMTLIQLLQKSNQRKATYSAISPEDIYNLMKPYAALDREHFWVITLDTKLQVLGVHEIYKGSINTITGFRIAEILRPAIVMNAASIVLVHNHPSGVLEPSPDDISTTRAILHNAKGLDIALCDHIIIGTTGFYSIKAKHTDVF